MTINIKSALFDHADGITRVFRSAFKEDISISDVHRSLEKEHYSLVALDGSRVVGLTGGFITTSITGEKRLELDLQAVHPDYQRQGIGTQLIKTFCNTKVDFDLIRALVAIDNHTMQRTMQKTGFSSDMQSYSLYISKENSDLTLIPADAHLVSVTTLSYQGVWLEGIITPQAIHAALSQQTGDLVIGAVVPVYDTSAIHHLRAEGFNHIRDFHWWIWRN